MNHLTSSIIVRVILGLFIPAVLFAGNGDDLARNSPFLPEGFTPPREGRPTPPPRPQPPPGPQPLDQLEFRGMTTFDGETSFSLYDPNQQRSFWIPLGRGDGGFEVVEFKEREDAVVVKHDGKTRTISLHQAKVAALPDTPPAVPPQQREPGRSRETATQPQDPEERMRNLADEIRRRREIRRALVEESESNQQTQAQGSGRVVRPAVPRQ